MAGWLSPLECKAQTDAYIIHPALGYYAVQTSNSFSVYFHFGNSVPSKVNQVDATIIGGNHFSVTNYFSSRRSLNLAGDYLLATITPNIAGYYPSGSYSFMIELNWYLNGPWQWTDTYEPEVRVGIPPANFINQKTNSLQLSLQLTGTPHYPYTLQSATNLTPPVNWLSIVTNSADTNGNWQFTVTNLNGGQKFYRAMAQ